MKFPKIRQPLPTPQKISITRNGIITVREVTPEFRLITLVWHFLCRGAICGLNLMLDTELQPRIGVVWVVALGGLAATFLAPPLLQLGLLLIAFSPVWLYMFSTVPDIVMEARGYLLGLGVACLAAWSGERAPWAIVALILVFTLRTIGRNRAWRTGLIFWKTAHEEAPGKIRPIVNYGERLMMASRLDEARVLFESVIDKDHPSAGTACANLSLIYLMQGRGEEAANLLNSAVLRFPNHPIIRNNRGSMLMGLRMFEEAILEYNCALAINPKLVGSIRNRARCWAFLHEDEKAVADEMLANSIDGAHIKVGVEV